MCEGDRSRSLPAWGNTGESVQLTELHMSSGPQVGIHRASPLGEWCFCFFFCMWILFCESEDKQGMGGVGTRARE